MSRLSFLKKLPTKRIYVFGDAPEEDSVGTDANFLGINQSSQDWRQQLGYVEVAGEKKWYDWLLGLPLDILIRIFTFLFFLFLSRGSDLNIYIGPPRKLKTLGMIIGRSFFRTFYFLIALVIGLAVIVALIFISLR